MKDSMSCRLAALVLSLGVLNLEACCHETQAGLATRDVLRCTSRLGRAQAMIRMVLDDVADSYDAVQGGGISEIREQARGKYSFSIRRMSEST